MSLGIYVGGNVIKLIPIRSIPGNVIKLIPILARYGRGLRVIHPPRPRYPVSLCLRSESYI